VLVTGGHVPTGGTTKVAVYDPATGSWTTVGPMSTPRFKHVSVLLPDGRALILGGTTDDREILATTELFDPRTGRFTPGPTMRAPRYKLAGGAVVLDDGRVLVGGGATTVEALDVGRGTSRPVATPRASGSFTTVTALRGDHYQLLGGYDDHIRLSRQIAVLSRP
jgi:Galactose oxidase, central domain